MVKCIQLYIARFMAWYEDEQVIRKMRSFGYSPEVIKEHRRVYKLKRKMIFG